MVQFPRKTTITNRTPSLNDTKRDSRKHFNNYCCAVFHGRPYVGSDGEPIVTGDGRELFGTAHYRDGLRTQGRILVAYDEKRDLYLVVGLEKA
jgi:hypothetical protein